MQESLSYLTQFPGKRIPIGYPILKWLTVITYIYISNIVHTEKAVSRNICKQIHKYACNNDQLKEGHSFEQKMWGYMDGFRENKRRIM